MHIAYVPERDFNEHVCAMVAIITDITPRKLAEVELNLKTAVDEKRSARKPRG